MSSLSEPRVRPHAAAVATLDQQLRALERRPRRRPRIPAPVQFAVMVALVSVQLWIDYRQGLISDLSKLYFVHHLYTHPFPYAQVRIEYPVLTGVYMTAAAALTHGLHAYMVLSSLGLWALAIGCLTVLWSSSRRAAWAFALCPLLLVYSLLNWDLLAIFLMLLGWRAWQRERYSLSVVWLTLGTFAKLYPAFLLALCLVELARRARAGELRRAQLLRPLLSAAAVTLLLNGPFAALNLRNWLYFWSFNASRNEHADLLAWLGLLHGVGPGNTNLVLSAIVLGAIGAGALAVWRGAATQHVAALVFFAFMEMQKIYSPQYTLWLVAFALLAGWEVWALVVLSLLGLMSYANAAIHIEVVHHGRSMLSWYDARIGPAEQGVRLVTIAGVALGAAHRRAASAPRLGSALAPAAGS